MGYSIPINNTDITFTSLTPGLFIKRVPVCLFLVTFVLNLLPSTSGLGYEK